jgi:cytochrome c556
MTTATRLMAHLHGRDGRAAIGCAILAAGTMFVASATPVPAQDQTVATPADAIIARKTMMGSLSDRMDDIEGAISAGKVNLDAAHANADTISVFLMAFPHMFPAATNQWKPNVDRDPATDTFASPDIWTKFADFYTQATAASKSAYNASRAQNESELKAAIAQLRTQCNICHEVYLKPN